MKKLFIFIFIFFAKNVFAQKDTVGLNIPIRDGAVVFERLFDAQGKSKTELYNNAQLWLASRYRNINSIQTQDADLGRVVGKGDEILIFKGALSSEVPYNDRLTIQIDCKDGRYRCRFYNMSIESKVTGTTG